MKTILFTLHELGYTAIDLGKHGENGVREIDFDLRDWIAEYPGASVALYISQPNTIVYLAATKLEEGILKWPILNTYTASPGFGSAEIVMSGKNGERLKSATANIFVSESMSEDEQGEAPEYMKPYADQVAENAAKVEKALEEIKSIDTQSGKMPTGGDPGQILAKKSNADYDTHWINPPEGSPGGSDPDAVKSVTVNGTKHEPDEDGNVDLGTIRGGEGGAQYINELLPDPNEESVDEENVVLPVNADNSEKLGGKAPEYYLQPVNLLDNSDFSIAQAGYNAYHGSTMYLADRWLGTGGSTVSKVQGGISITPKENVSGSEAVWQYVEKDVPLGAMLTVAMSVGGVVYVASGALSTDMVVCSTPFGRLYFQYSSGKSRPYAQFNVDKGESVVVNWIALYEGTYTAETLPPYVPKGYANELLACEVAEKGNIFGMDLLWTNESPTSVFPQQAIFVNTTKYDGFLWQMKSWNGTSYISTWLSMDTKNEKNHTLYAISDKSLITRTINIRDNQIYVYQGRNMDIPTTTFTEDDKYAVPVKLYGVRGVSV